VLKDAKDRIFCTSVKADWTYNTLDVDYNAAYNGVRNTLLDVFSNRFSKGVQETLFHVGKAVVERVREVDKIHFVMPNIHFLPFDLDRFGIKDEDQIFMPVEAPSGCIEGTIGRPRAKL